MISFKQFISEALKFNIEQFRNDCSYVLNMIDSNHIMYRGIGDTVGDVAINKWYPREEPLTTPKFIHDEMNKVFVDLFGEPIRNWMFCTGEKQTALAYTDDDEEHQVYAIFPIGKFEWVCSLDWKFRDLTGAFQKHFSDINASKPKDVKMADWLRIEEKQKLALERIKKEVDPKRWRKNTDLKGCIESHNEIMIKCDRYYRVSITSPEFKQIMSILK